MSAVRLSLAALAVLIVLATSSVSSEDHVTGVTGKEASKSGELVEREGGRLETLVQPLGFNHLGERVDDGLLVNDSDLGENQDKGTVLGNVSEASSESSILQYSKVESSLKYGGNFIEKTTNGVTVVSDNGQLVAFGANFGEIDEKTGKVSNNSANNFTSVNQLVAEFSENPDVLNRDGKENSPITPGYDVGNPEQSESPLRLDEFREISGEKPISEENSLHSFHSTQTVYADRSTATGEEFSPTAVTNTEAPCLESTTPSPTSSTPCHCTTQPQPRNESVILEDFRRLWPVEEWLAQGFFSEEYLLKIPLYWLSFPPPAPEAHYFLAAAYVVVMLVGAGGNLLVIVMFCRCKSLKTPANILVMNLAFSDLMMLLKMPIFIYNSLKLGPALGELGCQIYGFIGGLTGTVSIATLAAIGLDRYYVIVHPLDPLRRTTRLRARLCVVFVWLYGFTFAVLPLTELQLSRYVPEGFLTSCSFDYLNPSVRSRSFILVFFTAAWVVPFIVLTFSYLAICHVVVQAREVPPGGDSSRHCRENDKRRTELRLAEVVLGVVGLWFVSWTPYAVVALLGVSGNQQLLTPLGSMVPALLAKMASAADPYVYAINHPRFRLELTKSWHRIKGKPQFRASQARSMVMTMHEPSVQGSNSSQSDDFQLNVLQPQEQEPEAAGTPVELTIVRRDAELLPPTWFRPPKPKRNRSTSLRLKSKVKDVQEKAVFYSYSETQTAEKNEVD